MTSHNINTHQVAGHVVGATVLEVGDVVLVGENQQSEHRIRGEANLTAVDVPVSQADTAPMRESVQTDINATS